MSELIYIKDLAKKVGKSESSIRNLIKRRSNRIPPPFKFGGMWAWKADDVDEWINTQPKLDQYHRRSNGRPRGS